MDSNKTNAEAATDAPFSGDHKKRPGVVYLSRVPPHFSPNQLRALLQKHAALSRIYLQPTSSFQDAAKRLESDIKKKNAKRVNFCQGWVEFVRAKDAKRVALLLNNMPMGGKRRAKYHDDLWNIKYLNGFTWADLAEEFSREKKRKNEQLKFEIGQAVQERDFYLSRIDQGKAIESIKDRKESQGTRNIEGLERKFEQRATSHGTSNEGLKQSQMSREVLAKIFENSD